MAKARKSKAKKVKAKSKAKSKAKKSGRPSRKRAKKAKRAAASSRGRAVKSSPQRPAGKAAVKKAAPKKQRPIGEGDYEASRSFLKDQSDFVKSHESEISKMGKDAERAMEGSEGNDLRAAEEEAKSHSKAMGE